MGTRREAACDRDWPGGLGLAHSRLGSVQISNYELSTFAAALTRVGGFRRARRAATGRAACELWGLGLAPSRLGSVQISNYELSTFAAALTRVGGFRRARRAATGRAACELWG